MPDESVFKQTFLDLLEGRAAEPFPDGYITGEELGFYLKNEVPIYNKAQHPQYGKIQNPNLDKGDFVFVLPKEGGSSLPRELPTVATLTVESTPSGTDIYIDSGRIGKTPLTGYKVDTGVRREKEVEVGLALSGYMSRVAKLVLKGGQTTRWDVDLEKAPAPEGMVLIPAGEFLMGSNDGASNEKPVHPVYVDAFYMDVYEVTNAQYKKFVDANPQWGPRYGDDIFYLVLWNMFDDYPRGNYPRGKGNHPVMYVSWYGAMAYAQWAGKRLPTEAEWEKAARGGLVGKKYPWGDSLDSSKANYGDNVGDTTPVGSYPPNGYGLYDMAGNVNEWCLDAHDWDFYQNSPRRNPIGGADSISDVINNFTNVKNLRVLRGGSWLDFPEYLRVADRSRDYPSLTLYLNGFRCARTVSP